MLFNEKKVEFTINDRQCSFSTGKYARKATSIWARMGDTVVLAMVLVGDANPDLGYFPLSVEYMEKLYAAGLISSSRFVKRDRFPSDDAILRARVIDRSIRSRFPHDYRNEVEVIVKVLSYDPDNDPLILSINAVSMALLLSDAPINQPIGGTRIGLQNGMLKPLYHQVDRDNSEEISKMNLVLAGDGNVFSNIDADMMEIDEDTFLEAMEMGMDDIKKWVDVQKQYLSQFDINKPEYDKFVVSEDLLTHMKDNFGDKIIAHVKDSDFGRDEDKLFKEVKEFYNENFPDQYSTWEIVDAYTDIAKKYVRKLAVEKNSRIDGRALDEIRPLDIEVGLLPRAHGSGLFTRGGTQVLTVTTLGSIRKEQILEDMMGEESRRYRHFYIESPASHGEAGRVRYIPGRREVGHGALAEKALLPVLPDRDEFPYAIMLSSEILSEEGSSSMASTCGSSLSLMDAGVPIKRHVAGIAIGLMLEEDNKEDFRVILDMQAKEDFFGFMDFKVTGTVNGITAIQMDTKLEGISMDVVREAVALAKKGRLVILEKMNSVIPEPRSSVSKFAPKIVKIKVPVDKIGEIIGPGGKNIKSIIEDTNTEIDINEDGEVSILGNNQEDIQHAEKILERYSFVPEVGKVYEGVVTGITDFGAFVTINGAVTGLVHISELSDGYVKDVHDLVKEGQKVKVKVLEIEKDGKLKLSMKDVNQE